MARPYIGGTIAAVESKTSSFTYGSSDHGKTFVLSGSAITITLPTMSNTFKGHSFKVISGDDSEHVISGGASLIYYHGSYGTDHASNTGRDIHETVSSLTLNAGAINDTIDISCDGTYWYCSGSTKATVDSA
jgi:hypothetical protein|tara:strand:+ start:3725 stop:4120 length:396 start_codon:yes stop_codon:yes gene_type:complete